MPTMAATRLPLRGVVEDRRQIAGDARCNQESQASAIPVTSKKSYLATAR